jgi:cardiolipin synthase
MKWSQLPNALSIGRMCLVVPTVCALLLGHYPLTLLFFAVAAVSDALDGWIAKRFDWMSRLGKILDPIADKILLGGVILTLGWLALVPAWLVCAVVLRDVIIVGGAIAYRLLMGELEGHPTVISKLNTVLQLAFVLVVITSAAWPGMLPQALLTTLGAATFVTTAISGLDYVVSYARAAWQARLTQGNPL